MSNENHVPAGVPEGGQFGTGGSGVVIRIEPITSDIGSQAQAETKEEINNALYDGGYLLRKSQSHSEVDKEFLNQIATEHSTAEAWKAHKDLVENYVGVVKGYLSQNNFDIIGNGKYAATGRERTANELGTEFGYLSEERIKKLLTDNLTADDFVSSGMNISPKKENKGTVVMVFALTVEFEKIKVTKSGKPKKKKVKVNLYTKMVLNPHPCKGQKELQILSIKEADDKKCIFTGEIKGRRK